jgi:hypothetical protein
MYMTITRICVPNFDLNTVITSEVRMAAMLESVNAGRFITTDHLGLLERDVGSPPCFLLETNLKIGKEKASVNKTNLWLLSARLNSKILLSKAAIVRWPGTWCVC